MDAETARVLTLGLALFVPAAAVIWKGSDLRGDLDTKWSGRVDLARAGLSERAVVLLRRLQKQTDNVLGSVDDFDPDLALADPGPLAKLAGNIQKTIKVRDRLNRRFRFLVALGYAALPLGVIYALAMASALQFYLGAYQPRWLPEAGFWVAGGCAVAGLLLIVAKWSLEQRLITAERMTKEPDAGKRTGKAKGDSGQPPAGG